MGTTTLVKSLYEDAETEQIRTAGSDEKNWR